MDFDAAFHRLLGHEGNYSEHPDDPGGATRFGVTEKVARANGYLGDMRDYPVEDAKRIYRRAYWDAVRAEELPAEIRYAVFDAAVNSGVKQAVIWLQRSIGADSDGLIGPQTINHARSSPPDFVVRLMISQRLKFMTDLKTWPSFGKGWARRIAEILEA